MAALAAFVFLAPPFAAVRSARAATVPPGGRLAAPTFEAAAPPCFAAPGTPSRLALPLAAPWLAAEAAASDSAGASPRDDAPAVAAEPAAEPRRPKGASWYVWTGSAALIGLFLAGFAHDLAQERAAEEESEELPYFPDTP